jgi:hypothetical protein
VLFVTDTGATDKGTGEETDTLETPTDACLVAVLPIILNCKKIAIVLLNEK